MAHFTNFQTIFTHILQFFISVEFNVENKLQRQMAALISTTRMSVIVCNIHHVIHVENECNTSILNGISFLSVLFGAISHHFFLLADTKRFNSGLNAHPTFKTESTYLKYQWNLWLLLASESSLIHSRFISINCELLLVRKDVFSVDYYN